MIMLLTKTVKARWHNKNKDWYIEKGYIFTKMRYEFEVRVEDLPLNSSTEVLVKCDYCEEEYSISYLAYVKNTSSMDNLGRYSCPHCLPKKKKEYCDIKQHKGELEYKNYFYYHYKENILKDLKKHIDKYGTTTNLNTINNRLYEAIHVINKYKINELVEEVGYDYFEINGVECYGFYDNKNNFVNKINQMIEKYNRFPTLKEMGEEYFSFHNHLKKHFKNVQELKDYIGYKKIGKLIDNNNFENKSLYELIVANFLIAQGFGNNYKRERYPFKQFGIKNKYRSDFTLYDNDLEYHIEIWGYPKENSEKSNINGRIKIYNEKRLEKEKLYNKYSNKIKLINIDFECFQGKYDKIEARLFQIFNPLFDLKFENVGYDLLKPISELTEEEMLEKLLIISEDKDRVPTKKEMRKTEEGKLLLNLIVSKFGGTNYFADKYKLGTKVKRNNTWNEDLLFEKILYMMNTYGKYVTDKEADDEILKGAHAYVRKNGSYIFNCLNFIRRCFENNIQITEYFNELLFKVINRTNVKMTDLHVELANEIYNKYYNKSA